MEENPRVIKDPARARLSGGIFELRLAGLVSARLHSVGRRRPDLALRFLVATNMDGANPFDDIVLRLTWDEDGRQRVLTYFVQLKHAEKIDKPVKVHDLTGKVSKKNKDFNLRKYFDFFKNLKCLSNTSEELKGNQSLLQDWAQEECRFILFTTRDVLPKAKDARGTSSLDFPFEEVFSTKQGQAFSFGDTDEEIWDMMAGTSDEDVFRNEFLPRLRIFSAQAQVPSLKPLLARAFQDVLNGPPPRAEQLLTNYETFLHRWWNSDEGDCLSEQSTEVEDIIRDDINNCVDQLNFQTDICDALGHRLCGDQASFIIVPGIHQELRCSMIRTVLTKSHPGRFVLLTDTIIKEYPHAALHSVCEKLCDEVVLSTDRLSDDVISFLDKVITREDQNVRVLSSKWDQKLYTHLVSRFKLCTAWSEYWSLALLDSEEQEWMLHRRVSFQGHELALSQVEEEAWPGLRRGIGGAALDTLASEQTFSFGLPLPTIDGQYISRTVAHPVSLERSVFEICNPGEHFMLSGFPEQILEQIRLPGSPWQECSDMGVPLVRENEPSMDPVDMPGFDNKTKWTNLATESQEEKERQSKRQAITGMGKVKEVAKKVMRLERKANSVESKPQKRNLHWISYENDQLIWKKSEGSTDCLKGHVEQKNINCKYSPMCSHVNSNDFLTWKDTTLVLTNGAGMGKSTYITHLASVIKTANTCQWVIIIRMNEGQVMDKLPQKIEFRHVLRILSQYSGADIDLNDKSINAFLRSSIQKTGNITVLADGVDEVCPAHKTKALALLGLLQQALEKTGGRLFVASRTMLREDLAKTLHKSTRLSLQSLSRRDQELFLRKHWSDTVGSSNDSVSENDIKALVSSIREATNSNGQSLCDVPLYMRMVADAYSGEEIFHILNSRSTDLTSISNRGALYKRFVEKTLGIVWVKAGLSESDRLNLNITSQEVMQKHAQYAALECFHDLSFLGKYYDDLLQAVNELKSDLEREKIARTGIITHVVDGRPKFLHYTLAEYFAAFWLQDKYSTLPHLTLALYEGLFGEVRYFFDSLLVDGRSLHTAALTESVRPICSLLHLKQHNIEEEDSGGRRPLHLAAIAGYPDVVQSLLSNGAKPSKRDAILRWTPLRYMDTMIQTSTEDALRRSKPHLEIVDLLLKAHANPKDVERILNEHKIFTTAIKEDFAKVTEAVIRKTGWLVMQRFQNKTYMHLAAESNSLAVLSMLLRLGFRVNDTSPHHYGGTPLHVASARGHSAFCKILLFHGAKVDVPDRDGYTALHEAARKNHKAVCEVLLRGGADPNLRNAEGETPLHPAAREGHATLCALLLRRGADPQAENLYGRSAAGEALHWGRREALRAMSEQRGWPRQSLKNTVRRTANFYC